MNAEGPVVAVEAAERHGIDVVVVNPAYVLGVPVDHRQGCDTSTRTIATTFAAASRGCSTRR